MFVEELIQNWEKHKQFLKENIVSKPVLEIMLKQIDIFIKDLKKIQDVLNSLEIKD